ncbi:MAG: cytochrome c biogenesis protein CcdA, partial [Actinomycetota bacterium]
MIGLVALAFVAGAVSILSPCCLPIVPGYVSYIGGVAAQEEGSHRRVLGSAALFVLGFGVVFTILGATASALGGFLLVRLPLFAKIAGVFVIVMGFAMLGVLRIPFASGRGQVDLSTIRGKPATAFPLGMAFAFGWTPAVGPVL